MTKKQIGRCIAFALVVCLLLIVLCDLFEQRNNSNIDKRFTTFRELAEDTVDAVWIGTSGVDRYWIAAKAYEEYGQTLYTVSCDEMPAWLYTSILDDVLSRQSPELIIIDARPFGQDNTNMSRMEIRARRVLDAMEFMSVSRWKACWKTMKTLKQAFGDEYEYDLSYFLTYVKYHEMWDDDSYRVEKHLGDKESPYLGFHMNGDKTTKVKKQELQVYDSESLMDLDPISEQTLYEVIEYVKEKNLNVLFVDTPQFKDETETGRGNMVYKILEENDIPYINFCETDDEGNFLYDLNLDPEKDFYNSGHANYFGAEKFTAVFAKYLDENYDLPDRREDENTFEDWQGVYDAIKAKIAKWAK